MRAGKVATAVALAVLGLASAQPADAAYVVDLYQDGANVVATGSGSINTAGLNFFYHNGTANGTIEPDNAVLTLGPTSPVDWYTGYSGPSSFGPGSGASYSSETGQTFGINGPANWIAVPAGYSSNASLTSSATWNNTTLAALGATPGTYTWSWGIGGTADSLTLNIESPIPGPASLAVLAVGLVGLGIIRRRAE